MFFILGLNHFKQSMYGRLSDLRAMQLFPEEYASLLREEVFTRKTWLIRKFSPCSLRDCRDSVPIDSYSCMDRSKILSLFQPHNCKTDAHIFSLS